MNTKSFETRQMLTIQVLNHRAIPVDFALTINRHRAAGAHGCGRHGGAQPGEADPNDFSLLSTVPLVEHRESAHGETREDEAKNHGMA